MLTTHKQNGIQMLRARRWPGMLAVALLLMLSEGAAFGWTPPPCTATPMNATSVACYALAGDAGYTGTAYSQNFTTTSNTKNGGDCTPAFAGTYDTSRCVAPASDSTPPSTQEPAAGSTTSTLTGKPSLLAPIVDSTDANVSFNSKATACVTVNGTLADGSKGTPKGAPYNGGNWFASVAAASAYFKVGLVATSPGVCVTPNCTSGLTDGVATACSAVLGSGETGTAYAQSYTTYPGLISCNPVAPGAYDTSGCSVVATPNCNTGATDGSTGTACSSVVATGYTGLAYPETYTTYSGGGSCTQASAGWDTSKCVAPATTPNCNATPKDTATTAACPAGYTGSEYLEAYTTYTGGGSCTVTSAGAYDTSGCVVVGTPNCTTGVSSTNISCATAGYPGYTGNGAEWWYTTSPSGTCNTVVTSTPPSNYSIGSCVLPNCNATPNDSATSATCASVKGSGYSGTAYLEAWTTVSGGGSCIATSAGIYDTSGCMTLMEPAPPAVCPLSSLEGAFNASGYAKGGPYPADINVLGAIPDPYGRTYSGFAAYVNCYPNGITDTNSCGSYLGSGTCTDSWGANVTGASYPSGTSFSVHSSASNADNCSGTSGTSPGAYNFTATCTSGSWSLTP